jgi:hypothetical protein
MTPSRCPELLLATCSLTICLALGACSGADSNPNQSADAPGSADAPAGSADAPAGSTDAPLGGSIDAPLGGSIDAAIAADAAPAPACVVTATGTLTIEFNQSTYAGLDWLVACGRAPASTMATFQVFEPQFGNFVGIAQTTVDASGLYDTRVIRFPAAANSTYPVGTYTVRITDGTQTQGTVEYSP